jgi:hypothetical protein
VTGVGLLVVPLVSKKPKSELKVKNIVKCLKIQVMNYVIQTLLNVDYQY